MVGWGGDALIIYEITSDKQLSNLQSTVQSTEAASTQGQFDWTCLVWLLSFNSFSAWSSVLFTPDFSNYKELGLKRQLHLEALVFFLFTYILLLHFDLICVGGQSHPRPALLSAPSGLLRSSRGSQISNFVTLKYAALIILLPKVK